MRFRAGLARKSNRGFFILGIFGARAFKAIFSPKNPEVFCRFSAILSEMSVIEGYFLLGND
jgi:hypothetical protein